MKENKNVIILVLLSMVLPLAFLIFSIYVYEDETPWEGFTYIQDQSPVHYTYYDDFHTKEACHETMIAVLDKQKKTNPKLRFMCKKN